MKRFLGLLALSGVLLGLSLWQASRLDVPGEVAEKMAFEGGKIEDSGAEGESRKSTVILGGSRLVGVLSAGALTDLDRRSELLDEKVVFDSDGERGKVTRLVRAEEFTFPVRIEYAVVRDAGGLRVLRVQEMAGNQILARRPFEMSEEEWDVRMRTIGADSVERLGSQRWYQVEFLGDASVDTVPLGMRAFYESLGIASGLVAEPNYIVHASEEPDDVRYADGSLWGMQNVGQDGGLADADIDAPEGWQQRTDASTVVVAVVDTGIKYDHVDLVSNVWINEGEIAGNGIDDDGNGYVDDVHGINAVTKSGDPMDDNGHGTHCAGTIGAVGDNGQGVVGVAWKVQLMGLKFLTARGSGTVADAVLCVDYATRMGAQVVSNSWGGSGYSEALEDAIGEAEAAGSVFVVAAGNASVNTGEVDYYPANYELSNVVTVASIDRRGELSPFSNYGFGTVDLAAPGSDILSLGIEGSNYVRKSGTSMATPHVSGVAALLWAEYPGDSYRHQINRLKYGVEKRESLVGKVEQEGVLNLANSLAMVDVPFPPELEERLPVSVLVREGEAITLSVAVASEAQLSYRWFRDGVEIAGATESIFEVSNANISDGGVYEVVVSNEDGDARSVSSVAVLSSVDSLADASEASPLGLYTHGDKEWEVYAFDSVVGEDSIRSGGIGDDERSTVFLDVEGPAEVSFWWRVSSEAFYDYGIFSVDDEPVALLWEEGDWDKVIYSIENSGVHRLSWTYSKDGSVSEGQDGLFLDGIEYRAVGDGPPIITVQPQAAVLAPASSHDLLVGALGEGLSYLWFYDATPIEGADEARLRLVDVSADAVGEYFVQVWNEHGLTQSSAAFISVAEQEAVLVGSPRSLEARTGMRARFEVKVGGALPIVYQWFKDGVKIEGAVEQVYEIGHVEESDAGEYSVEFGNVFNLEPVKSSAALLTVEDVASGPEIVKHPADATKKEGESQQFFAAAEGSFPMTYQWYRDGEAIVGATERTLLLPNVAEFDGGTYQFEAQNSEGIARSEVAQLVVIAGLEEALDLEGVEWDVSRDDYFYAQTEQTHDGSDAVTVSVPKRPEFGYATLETQVVGPGNLSWFWKQDSYLAYESAYLWVDDEIAASLTGDEDWTQSFAKLGEGTHEVSFRYSYQAGQQLWIDEVALSAAPHIYREPKSRIVKAGDSLELTVDAWGGGTLAYQWYRGEQAIAGAVGASLEIDTNAANAAGVYRVNVSTGAGSVSSSGATIEVLAAPEDDLAFGGVELNFAAPVPWEFGRDAEERIFVRSPLVEDDADGWFEAVVMGPTNLVFEWRILGEDCCPSLTLTRDGLYVWSGTLDFEEEGQGEYRKAAFRVPEGAHVYRWAFNRGYGTLPGDQHAEVRSIEVTENPVFDRQPVDALSIEGEQVQFVANAIGSGALSYQWRKVGSDDILGTQATLRIVGDAVSQGTYQCTVVDGAGRSEISDTAELRVVGGFYEALGARVGDFRRLQGEYWETAAGAGSDGGDAVAVALEARGSGSVLRLDLYDIEGDRKALRFYLKIENLPADGNLVVKEGFGSEGRRIRFEDDREWTEVVLPLSADEGRVVTWNAYRGVGAAAGAVRILLDRVSLVSEPVAYATPKSIAGYWGDDAVLTAEVIGETPMAYVWRKGESMVFSSEAEADFEIERIDESDTGSYRLEVSNAAGEWSSEPISLSLLSSHFGAAVGQPGRMFTLGDRLWETNGDETKRGDASLTVGELGPEEWSDLRWQVTGPGTLRLNWKLDSPTDRDRMYMAFDGYLVSGLYGDADWNEVEVGIEDSSTYEVSVRMVNQELDADARGRGWVDAVRFEREEAERYEEWAAAVFGESAVDMALRAWDADADGDGVANFAEYGARLDALSKDELPEPTLVDGANGKAWVVDFAWRPGADDVGYGLQVSRDLENWYPLSAIFVGGGDDEAPLGTLVYPLEEADLDTVLHVRFVVYFLDGLE